MLRALVGLPHLQQATALARALLTLRFLPSLAFSANDVDAYLEADSFAVLVLHLAFRQVLAKDIWDVRSIVGSKYNSGLLDLIDYYRTNFPELMAKGGAQ